LIYNSTDAAKRKQLPAWIREGLEKMEKEKRRKIKQELSFAELDYSNFMNENVTQELPNVPNVLFIILSIFLRVFNIMKMFL